MSLTHLPQLNLEVLKPTLIGFLMEDIARGDITGDATVPAETMTKAKLSVRHDAVVSGVIVFKTIMQLVDPNIEVDLQVKDGERVVKGRVLALVTGPARSVLKAERTALNLLQRMTGVASQTHAYVNAVPAGATLRITDTRKTTPGLRLFERYAVRCGGGHNHREDLSSSILIKDNHIAAAGGVKEAILAAKRYAPHTSKIECEVQSFAQLEDALSVGVDIVMLDNFNDDDLLRAVGLIQTRAVVEVSGGVTLERIAKIAAAGVDVISIGALTHSVKAADIGLDFD